MLKSVIQNKCLNRSFTCWLRYKLGFGVTCIKCKRIKQVTPNKIITYGDPNTPLSEKEIKKFEKYLNSLK